jgi:hypothetical protein
LFTFTSVFPSVLLLLQLFSSFLHTLLEYTPIFDSDKDSPEIKTYNAGQNDRKINPAIISNNQESGAYENSSCGCGTSSLSPENISQADLNMITETILKKLSQFQ